ncbi:MAG: ATP-binding cassette domain-containing protein [Clostridia bacterium]
MLGRNGSGKSTIFRNILNIQSPDSGTVLFNGKKINFESLNDIGYLIEEGCLTEEYTVYNQFITFGILKNMSEEEVLKSLIYWLDRFNISEYLNKKIKDISKGNRQKLQFIVAIMHKPKLLILDEPFSGLDPVSIIEFKNVILELKNFTTIIFSSHRMEHIELLCDDILFIHDGVQLLYGDLNKIIEEYDIQKIIVDSNIDDELILRKVKNKENTYTIYIYKQNLDYIINKLDCKYKLLPINLEDIFIDKVGLEYEK